MKYMTLILSRIFLVKTKNGSIHMMVPFADMFNFEVKKSS